MIKNIILLISVLFSLGLSAQEEINWVKFKDYALTYNLPDFWDSDPFSSSSVCDCPGTINSNGDWDEKYLGMVVYPCESGERLDENRSQVWGYEFVSDGQENKIKYGGIEYKMLVGTFDGMKNDPVVWKFYSLGDPGKGKKHLVIYFWGNADEFQDNIPVFKSILESIKRVKV